ncbi:MAG: Spy/CpxP family protein refolding chaperone [Bacteroidota bacterium]
MKNLKINALWMTVVVLLISSVGVSAQNEREDRESRSKRARMEQRGPRGPMIPDLTDEQNAKLKEIRLEGQKQKLPLRNELREKEARMKTLTTAENVDMKAINKLIEEIGAIKVKMAKIQAVQHQEVRNQLTEDQRVVFDSHAGQRMKKRMMAEHSRGRQHSGR